MIGKILVRKFAGQTIFGRIVEVEAYAAFIDAAAHSFKGETPRTKSLFQSPGHAYVYSIHRYHCLDIVTEPIGTPSSVLIRALEPVVGIETMQQLRQKTLVQELTSGPGKLAQAMAIT